MATATKKKTTTPTPTKATAKKKETAKQPAPAPAAAEPKPKATPKKPKAPGVQAKVTRPYLAGQIIGKHGLAAGVTPAMVAELNEAYGKANDVESTFCLKNAWHACRAYAGVAEDAIA